MVLVKGGVDWLSTHVDGSFGDNFILFLTFLLYLGMNKKKLLLFSVENVIPVIFLFFFFSSDYSTTGNMDLTES